MEHICAPTLLRLQGAYRDNAGGMQGCKGYCGMFFAIKGLGFSWWWFVENGGMNKKMETAALVMYLLEERDTERERERERDKEKERG